MDLPVEAFVDAFVTVPDPARLEWLEDQREYLMGEVRVRNLHLLRPGEKGPLVDMEGEWKIENADYRVGITRALS